MKFVLLLILTLVFPFFVFAQSNERDREWNQPVEPFKIIGNVYYVGVSEMACFLVVTPKGHFLLDAGFAETPPRIKESIKKLGFKVEDVKFLLNSQAHYDHSAGLAEMKRATGAKMLASAADKILLENGGKGDFAWGDDLQFEAVKVDRIIKDGEKIKLGGTTIKAILTPGHTKGCTTWVLTVKENGKRYQVVFVGGTSAPGYKLVNNEKYPNIVADYEKTFAALKSLKPDVFLGAHGSYFGLEDKIAAMRSGKSANPFIDAEGYMSFIERADKAFHDELKKQITEGQKAK